MKKRARAYLYCCFATLFLSMLLGEGLSAPLRQDPPAPSQNPKINMSELLKLPGRELARGRNSKPVGHHKVTTYLIEEVTLPHPTEVEIRGKTKRVAHAFRVTIFGGPFQVASLAWIIRIGDEVVGWKSGDEGIPWAVEHKHLDAITAVTFDRSLLREGATLHACYAGCTELPEKLKLKGTRESEQ